MYCPKCLTEYRAGFSRCADCHVALIDGAPPAPAVHDTVDPVTVLETNDVVALGMATAALRDSGIDCLICCDEHGHHPDFPTAFPVGYVPSLPCLCRIQVMPEFEEEARELLAPLRE